MAYKITDSCVACGSCIGECPVEAISAGDIYVIDADKCIDCGTCSYICPAKLNISGEIARGKREMLNYMTNQRKKEQEGRA